MLVPWWRHSHESLSQDEHTLRSIMPGTKQIETRKRYKIFADVTTRWKDNDVHGHINTAVYTSWIDTAVSNYFRNLLPPEFPNTPTIPVTAETCVIFHHSITHPADVETGFRVNRIGNSSVICGVGIFLRGESEAAAWGHMVHVWIDREFNKPVPIPDAVRRGLSLATVEGLSASGS